jgi:hypothetical protein
MAGGVTCRASLPQEGGPRCTPCLYRQAILGRIRPILVSHAVDLATATTSHDDGRAKPTSPLAQHCLRQLERQAPTRQTTSRSWTQGSTTPTRPAQPCGGLPTAALTNLTSTGHRGRGDARTADAHREPDAEHRRPASGHLDARTPGRSDVRTGHWTPVAWTGKRGHWSLAPDTGRRTLAGDAGRVTTARVASRPPGPPRPVIVRWDAQLCSCGRDLRGSAAHTGSVAHTGSAVRSPVGVRLPLALPCSAQSLRRH